MAYRFTSANSQYLEAGSAPVTAEPLTMACWCAPAVSTNGVLVSIGTNAGTSRWQMNHGSGGSSNLSIFAVNSSGTAGEATSAGSAYTVNSFVHVCGVCSSSTSREIYVNGASAGTNSTSITVSGVNSLDIGSRIAGGARGAFASADIAEVGIWNVALTAAEIASLATGVACRLIRPQSLVFYAPLIRDLIDYKGGLTITNNNSATVANHPRVYS